MSLNYEHVSEEEVTDLLCSLLNDYEKKQQALLISQATNEVKAMGNVLHCQDLVNACREFIEVATMNNPKRSEQ